MVYTRKRTIGPDECLIYQLVESCLKLDLDYPTAIKAINIILKKHKKLFNPNNRTVRIEKMTYRNYRRYIIELKKMSTVHTIEVEKEDKDILNSLANFESNKPKELIQLENLLFLLNEDNDQVMYKKYVKMNTDELIIKALIYLDKKYVF